MRRRVLGLILAATLLAVTLLGAGTYIYVRKLMIERTEERMEDIARLLLSELEPGEEEEQAKRWLEALNAQYDVYRLTLMDAQGQVFFDSDAAAGEMENHLEREEISDALQNGTGRAMRYSPTTQRHYLYVAVYSGGTVLRISQDFVQIRQMQGTILGIVTISALLTLLATGLASFPAAQKLLLDPIRALRVGAGRIAQGDLNSRIPDQPAEMGMLAKDFNAMAASLSRSLSTERMQRAQLQAVLHAIPAGVIAVDEAGVVTQCNPEAVRLLNLSGENVGKKLMESTRDTRLCALAEDTVRENAPQSDEWTGERVLAVSGAPIRTGGGKSVGAALVISDRTQLRKLEQMRSEFVSNATHELKTPLTAIRGCIETLQEPEMAANPQIASEMLEIMDVQGERLQALISDMLELSQIESLPQLDGETGSLSKAVEEAADAVRMQAEKREVALHLQIADGVICRAGQERMRRIAQNLIENAVRYNKPGGNVWVEVRAEGTTGMLAVKDDGIGIPEKDLPRICERFYRVDKDRSRNSGGTGLGLAIVKHLVRRYNGEMEIRSKVNEGTNITILLPMEGR